MPPPPRVERRIRREGPDRYDFGRDLRVAQVAAEQWGVLSLAEFEACGMPRQLVAERALQGFFHRLYPAVYAVGHPNPPRQGRLLAAVKACGRGAVLSHYAAAELWGLMKAVDRHPDVTVPSSASRAPRRINLHRSQYLDPRDLATREGIPVTTPVRTVVDLSADLSESALRRLLREALARHRISPRSLANALTRLGPRRGIRKLRRLMATGMVPTRSELEDVVYDLLLAGGLEPPVVNEAMRVGDRWVVPDFRWPEQRLVLEADGARWHDNALARPDDRERQRLLEAAGERVLRVTWHQAVDEPGRLVSRLLAAGAPPAQPRTE